MFAAQVFLHAAYVLHPLGKSCRRTKSEVLRGRGGERDLFPGIWPEEEASLLPERRRCKEASGSLQVPPTCTCELWPDCLSLRGPRLN